MPPLPLRVEGVCTRLWRPILFFALAFAGCEGASDAGGAGASVEPKIVAKAAAALENAIEIDTCSELQAIGDDLYANYVLTADVDCAGFDAGDSGGFFPVGTVSAPFRGNFDGQAHVIRNLTIDRSEMDCVGLFGATQFGFVRNVGLENVHVRGFFLVGSFAGAAYDTDFTEIFATGFVAGDRMVGGLIGVVKDATVVADAYSSVAVDHTSDEDTCGLLFAWQLEAEPIRIYSNGTASHCAPALVGTAEEGQTITTSFYDCTLAGNCDGIGAETSAALKRSSHYEDAGWNLSTVWQFDTAGTYPCLAWQADCGTADDSDGDDAINAVDGCPTDPAKLAPGPCGCHVDDSCLPIEIHTCAELQGIQYRLEEDYVLMSDIDCAGFDGGDGGGFTPIGTVESPFVGTLDGNGYVIRNISIDRPYEDFQGLFSNIYEAKLHDFGLENVVVHGSSLTGSIASLSAYSELTQLYATGEVSGSFAPGGLVGYLLGSTLTDSYAHVDIDSEGSCGLVAGVVVDGATIRNAYATGDASACAAGLGTDIDGSTVVATFFDCEVSGACEASGAETTEDLQTPAFYAAADWDLEDVWGFPATDTYPCLLWQPACRGDCLEDDSICNNLDDDCDGEIDEDFLPRGVGCGTGSCVRTGATTCVDGEIVDDCTPGVPSEADTTCNGADEDCDGLADEAYAPIGTTCGIGACAATGTSSCIAGTIQSGCTPGMPAANDSTCDGVDGDCNGTADEDYVPTATTCSVGACAATGSLVCVGGSVVDTCSPGAPSASDITCDGIDDDCDGVVDDNWQPVASSCQQAGCLASGTIQCVSGVPQDQCPTLGACIEETNCADDVDNDQDNATDCSDPDCATVSGCVETNCGNGADDNGNGLTDCADPGCDGAPGCVPEICGNSLDDDGDGLTDCADLDCDQHSSCLTLPPTDLSAIAPPLNPLVVLKPIDALRYIYEGEDPIQRGVQPGAIEPERVSLLSGRVLVTGGGPLAGVMVDILGRPELGVTHTDENGVYHMAVNAGGTLTARFQLAGYIPAQRAVDTLFQQSAKTEDLVLLPRSETVTEVDFSGATSSMQVVLGDVETDDDGSRRAVLMIPAGTEAQIYDASGALVPVTDFNLRMTEQTVGDRGDLTMPATLPPTTGYTYAVDITGDEALYKRNGVDTVLSNPVIFYVDNYRNIEIGAPTPSGYLDNDAGIWRAIDSGIVLKIVAESGGVAELDLTGDEVAEDSTALAAIGITTAERQQLATLYEPGKSLRRVMLPHLSSWDHNDGAGPENETPPPPLRDGHDDGPLGPDCRSPRNSTIDCFTRRLSEDIAVPGTPFSLHYDTSQVEGWKSERTIEIPIKVPNFSGLPVRAVRVTITPPVGDPQEVVFVPGDPEHEPPEIFTWQWDGLNVSGQPLYGRFDVKVETAYVYRCVYTRVARFADRRGYALTGSVIANTPGSGSGTTQIAVPPPDPCTVSLKREGTYHVQNRDMRVEGLGGWSLNVQHRLAAGTMHRGDGERVAARGIPRSESVVAYPNAITTEGAGVPDFAVGSDGTIYYIDQTGVRWFRSETERGLLVEGGPCTASEHSANKLCRAIAIASSPTGRLFVADQSLHLPKDKQFGTTTSMRILEIEPNTGAVKRIAGSQLGFSGDGGPALDARFNDICDMAAASDGSLYVLNCVNAVVQRITPDGMVERVAGTGSQLAGDQILVPDATQVPLSFAPSNEAREGGIGLDASGGIYIAQTGYAACTVLYLDRGGRLSVVLTAVCRLNSSFNYRDVAVSPTGGLTLAGSGTQFNRIISHYTPPANAAESGSLQRVAGFTSNLPPQLVPLPNAYPAQDNTGMWPEVVYAPNGELYFSEQVGSNARIRKLTTFAIAGGAREFVASSDASEIYQFDAQGRHLRTRHPLTGADLLSFAYDESGLLETIVDEAGNETQIERNSNGIATAIVAPFGQRTELNYDSNGYLSSIATSTNDQPNTFTYDASGLMSSYVDPRGSAHNYEYDDVGRIELTEDSEGGSWSFATTSGVLSNEVTMTSELGRVTTYRSEQLANGDSSYTVTLPSGAQNKRVVTIEGVATTTMANGTVATNTIKSHPLYGGDAPIINSTTTTRGSMASGTTGAITRSVTRQVSVSAPLAPASWFPIAALSETTSVTGSNNQGSHITTRTYNATTRTWTLTSAEGRVSTATLDTLGRLTASASAGEQPFSIDYDPEGRVEAAHQGSRSTTFGYASTTGFLETSTNSEDETTTFTTDDVGRVTAIENANEDVTAFAYDDESNVTGVTPADRSLHSISYSSVDLYDGYTAPAVGSVPRVTTLRYDDDRALTEVEQPDGSSSTFGYHATTGLLETASIPGAGTFTYGYDSTSAQLTSVSTTGGFGSVAIEYGSTGTRGSFPLRVTAAGTFAAGGWSSTSLGGSAEYAYSGYFLPATVQPLGSAQNGFKAAYTWDRDDLLTGIAPSSPSTGPTLTFARSPLDGRLVATSVNGGMVTTEYDVDVSLTTPGTGDLQGLSASIDATEVFATSYQRDGLGRIERLDETVLGTTTTRKYQYDGAGRLTAVLDASDNVISEYAYDGNGARTRALTPSGEVVLGTNLGCGAGLDAPVDAQDRLCRYGDHAYAYDANGRLASKTNISTSAATQYTYDALGRLRSVVLPDTTEIDYAYDALGHRVGKIVGGSLVKGWRYGADPLKPLAELDSSGVISKTFIYGTRVNVPELIVDRSTGAMYRVITDHLGSVRMVVDVATGSIIQRLSYDEFGNVLSDTNPGFQPFGFAGGLYDADTGLVRFGARDYDAVTGRWTAKDPIGFAGGDTNLYAYCANDSVNCIDPTGEILPVLLAGAAIGAVANVGVLALGAAITGQSVSGTQLAAAAIGGAVAGALASVAPLAAGSLAMGLGASSTGAVATAATFGFMGGAGAAGQAVANLGLPTDQQGSVAGAALFAAVGGTFFAKAFPATGMNTLFQASKFGPQKLGQLFSPGTNMCRLNAGAAASSAFSAAQGNLP